jgi:kinesin family member 5
VGYPPPAPLSVVTHNLKPDLPINRFRPPNSLELREGSDIVVSFDDNLQTVQLRSAQVSSGPEKDGFSFDRVFPMGTKQDEVFDYGVKE